MNDIMKIVQALVDSNILLKRGTKTIKNETKEQRADFLGTLVCTLGSILLGNLLSGKGIVRAGPSSFNKLWNKKYYQNELRFNGIYSRNQLLNKIKDGAYVINLNEYKDTGTHWIAWFCNRSEIVYFNSFHVEHVPEEITEFIGNKNIKANIFRIKANNSIMCGYFCIGFIDFMLAGKNLTDYTSLLSPYDFEKNDDIILSYFKDEWIQFGRN